MSAARRQRAWRARQRVGRCKLVVEVDEVALAASLTEAGWLEERDADDRRKLAEAVERLVAFIVDVDA